MLVNVAAEEEYRVAVVDNGILDLFEIETLSRQNIKGNIFKAVVEGVNSALEAAFVNYGGERAAFLPLDEINFKLYPSRGGEGAGAKGRGSRINRHLEKGMEILVQVIRDSYASKPPTLSTYYSLPGRYLVLMPGADAAGISRKIEDEEQRGRLRRTLESLTIPEGYGVIVRTAGMETSPRDLQADLDSLLELWKNIERASQEARAPSLIYQERDLVIRTARDHFTSDIGEVLIDDEPTWRRLKKFFEAHMPEKADVVKLYTGDKPIFSRHNLEDQIERIYKRVVTLKSGGSISVDQTEALSAIDVNSARSVRGGSSEETAVRTNLEAAEEIARQLRLRDIGGLIVIDFIDMESSRHIRQVEKTFSEAMSRDKARYDITRISKLGLMEISRQRLKSTKSASSFTKCPTCSGDGMVRTAEAAGRAAFRKIQGRVARGELAGVKVYLSPEVALYLLNQKRDDLHRLESRYSLQIEIIPQDPMRVEQFEIEEIRREEPEITPMVTAEGVDQALVEGVFTPPVAAEPAPASGQAPEAAADGARRGRRRRRRRRRGGEPAVAAGAGAAIAGESSGGVPAADFGTGDLPVFSEGPDSEHQESTSSSATAPAAADEGSEAAGPEAGRNPGHRRRRRRRGRGRHRGAQPESGSQSQQSAERVVTTGERPSGWRSEPENRQPVRRRPMEAPRGALPMPEVQEAPRTAMPERSAETPSRSVTADDGVAAPGGESKPRRRWWRRAFKG
jgi:ribonuclease E